MSQKDHTMSRKEAKTMAHKLRGEGKTYTEIAVILTAQGYSTSKGPGITQGGVWTMLNSGGRHNRVSKRPRAKTPNHESLLGAILNLTGASDSDKIALMHLATSL